VQQHVIGAAMPPQPAPALGQLKLASERIAKTSDRIAEFLSRFEGSASLGLTESRSGGGGPAPESYRNDIDTLFMQIDRLEAAALALDSIG
jgi:hypothetical protein